MATLATKKQEVYDYAYALLGGGMVDVELDPVHYETALGKALSKFRQRSENSVEEAFVKLELIFSVCNGPGVTLYLSVPAGSVG